MPTVRDHAPSLCPSQSRPRKNPLLSQSPPVRLPGDQHSPGVFEPRWLQSFCCPLEDPFQIRPKPAPVVASSSRPKRYTAKSIASSSSQPARHFRYPPRRFRNDPHSISGSSPISHSAAANSGRPGHRDGRSSPSTTRRNSSSMSPGVGRHMRYDDAPGRGVMFSLATNGHDLPHKVD